MEKDTPRFEDFVDAVRSFDLDDGPARATAHTSAVSVAEWDKVEDALGE